MLQATGTAKFILEQTERISQQVNSAVRGQQMSDTELDLAARHFESDIPLCNTTESAHPIKRLRRAI